MNVELSSSSSASPSASSIQKPCLRVRREPFEYGLLPLPSLIFPDPASTLRSLRTRLLSEKTDLTLTSGPDCRALIDVAGISQALDLSDDEAQLVVETLLSVSTGQTHRPLVDSSASVSLDDLFLFLYIQNYKKPPMRPHKAAAAVADVWPSTSVFDGLISTLSPLQVRTSKKSVPLQVDEEAHQLAYVQKHLHALLSLLADPTSEDELDAQVLTLEQFNHMGFLLRPIGRSSEVVPLSQAAPFFANSDPDMPAAPVPVQQVYEWVLEHLSTVLDCAQEKRKENGPYREPDVTMADACANTGSLSTNVSGSSAATQGNWYQEGLTFVDGISKASVLKDENDVSGGSVKVTNCHDCVVYILAPMKYATVYGCSDAIVVLGPVAKVVRIEHCERVQFIVPSVRICITNCRECLFYLAVNQRPLILGENHNLQVAPYNTFYPKLESHISQVGINPSVNRWDKFLTLGVLDPHDSLPHAAGVTENLAEGASLLPPDRYMNFVIPKWNDSEAEVQPLTKSNPFTLPKAYVVALQQRIKAVDGLRQTLKSLAIDESRKQDLSQAIHVHFREWLFASGNIRQLYEFQESEGETRRMD